MATREIVVDLKVNADGAVSGLNNVSQSVDKVTEDVQQLNDATQSLTLEEKMQQINDEVKSGELSFRQLTRKLQDYQSIAVAAGANSVIGKEALNNAAQLKDQLDGLTLQTKNLSHDATNMKAAFELGQGVIAGFQAFKGVTAALGVESENLNKVMTQLQGLMALQMGLEKLHTLTRKESFIAMKAQAVATKGLAVATAAYNAVVGTSTGLMKAFRIALASTGIGLIVIGLVSLIANFEAVSGWVMSLIDSFGTFGEMLTRVGEFFGVVKKGSADLMEQERLAAEERRKQEQALADAHQARMSQIEEDKNATISAIDETIKAQELEIDTLKAQGRNTDELTLKVLEGEKAKLEAILDANNEKIESYIKYYTDLAALRGQDEESFKASMKAQGIDLEALQEKANALIEENSRAVQFAENKITAFKREQGEKRAAEAEKIQKEILAKEKQLNDAYLALEQQLTDALIANMEDGAEKELAILQAKQDRERDKLIQQHGENKELLKLLDEKQEQELLALQKKFEAERLKLEDQYINQLIDLRLENLEEGRDKELALLRRKHEQELAEIRKQYGEGTELEKELLIRQKEELNEVEKEFDEQARAEKEAEAQATLEKIQGYLSQAEEINGMLNEIGDRKIQRIKDDSEQELGILEKNKKAQLANENLTADQKLAIERNFALQEFQVKLKAAQKEDEIARKQFQREKALKLANIAIDTAGGIVKALASAPPPLSFVNAGIIGGIGAAQAALVATQQFQGSAIGITPPDFSAVNASGAANATGATDNQTGGGQQTDTTTNTDDLITPPPIIISQVEINKTQAEMAQIDEVSTL